MYNTLFLRIEEDDNEWANSMKAIERIQWQPTCIRAWTPLALKYICVQEFKLSKVNEEENETATISNFLYLFTLQVTKKFSFNILKTVSLKIEKKTSIEAQSEGEVKATGPIGENESKKDALSEADFGDSNPVALERTVWWMLSPHFGSQSRNESRNLRW